MGNPGSSPMSEIGVFLCNMIWQKLNAVICNETAVAGFVAGAEPVRIYPNPSQGQFFVTGYEGDAEIYNSSGLKVWQGVVYPGQPVSFPGHQSGIYLLNTGTGTAKFILKNLE
jgi:hypothetical protein